MAKIKLNPVEETSLATLFLRVKDATSPQPILNDIYAKGVLDQVEGGVSHSPFLEDDRWTRVLCARAKSFDTWCSEFLAKSRESNDGGNNQPITVLHLGCGLDSRVLRLAGECGSHVRWIDVDRPEVIALRGRLMQPPPEEAVEYHMMAANIADAAWLEEVPNDRPTLVIMEGLLMYLPPEAVEGLFKRLAARFSLGGQMLFDCLGTLMCLLSTWGWIPILAERKVTFKWGIDDPAALMSWHPTLRLQDDVLYPELPPWFGQWKSLILLRLPTMRKNMGRFVRYNF